MDINRLNEFITLATLLNYSKAANKLYLTQPALSRHIHDLENTLGAPLFIRDTHSVHLTSIGELFYHEAKEIVDRYNHALLLVKEASQNASGEIRLGFLGTASQNFLSEFVSEYTASHPSVKLSLNCGNLDGLLTELNEGITDLCIITHITKDLQSGLESETINSFRLYAIMHPNHPLSCQSVISLEALSGFPMINFSSTNNPLASDFNRQLFKKKGLKCNTAEEVSYVEEGVFLASINRGFFILPEYLLGMTPASLQIIPISDPHCSISLNLIWKKNNSNSLLSGFVNEFRDFIRNRFSQA